MAITFDTLTPNLVVTDVARSLAFYRDILGFTVIATVPDAAVAPDGPFVFVYLSRGPITVFLNDVREVHKESHGLPLVPGQSGVSMFIKLTGIHALHDAIASRVPIVAPLERKFYGLTEFGITDPDGYLITFAEAIP